MLRLFVIAIVDLLAGCRVGTSKRRVSDPAVALLVVTTALCLDAVTQTSAWAQLECPDCTPDSSTVHECNRSWERIDPNLSILNVPTFDSLNRPYFRARGIGQDDIPGLVYTLRDGEWVSFDFFDSINEFLAPDSLCSTIDAGGWSPSQIVFDAEDHAYTALEVRTCNAEDRLLLLYSTDYCETWQVYSLPYHDTFAIEMSYSADPLDGPPAILLFTRTEQSQSPRYPDWNEERQCYWDPEEQQCQPGWLGGYGDLQLLMLTKVPGGLALDPLLAVADFCLGVQAHSGGSNQVITQDGKVHVIWCGLTDWNAPGSPNYVRIYDRIAGQWGSVVELPEYARARDPNDSHTKPGIVMTEDSHLHAITGARQREFYHMRSSHPGDFSEWESLGPVNPGTMGTYLGFVDTDLIQVVYNKYWREGGLWRRYLVQTRWSGTFWEPDSYLLCGWPNERYMGFYHKLAVSTDGVCFVSFSMYDQRDIDEGGEAERYRIKGLLYSADDGYSWDLVTPELFQYGASLWLDFDSSSPQLGRFTCPYADLDDALAAVAEDPDIGTLSVKSGSSTWVGEIDQSVVITAPLGTVTIGAAVARE